MRIRKGCISESQKFIADKYNWNSESASVLRIGDLSGSIEIGHSIYIH